MDEIIENEGVSDTTALAGENWYKEISLEDAKTFIKSNIASAARSFIAVGFYLKHIRDHELFKEDGYLTVWELAKEEYGLSMSAASRYMKMNDRFSQDGNSPYVQEAYKGFGKSQLQEMLYLDDGQLEQVTPETQVMDIRNIRKGEPEESNNEVQEPIQILGQMRIEDFPDVLPEGVFSFEPEGSPDPTDLEQLQFQIQAGDLFPDSVAKSQQEKPEDCEPDLIVESQQLDSDSGCPPKAIGCRRQEWGTNPEEQEAGSRECRACWKEWKQRQKSLNAAEPLPEVKSDPIAAPEVKEISHFTIENGLIIDGAYGACLAEVVHSYLKLLNETGRRPSDKRGLDGEFKSWGSQYRTELLENIVVFFCKDRPVMDVEISRLQKEYEFFFPENEAGTETATVNLPEKIEIIQPELPLLKNNDQRKEWINGFHSWPIWFEVSEAAEKYYRYDFEDGSSFVICEYHYFVEWKQKYKEDPEAVGTREFLLKPGYHYLADCQSNISAMVEYLKGIQKAK